MVERDELICQHLHLCKRAQRKFARFQGTGSLDREDAWGIAALALTRAAIAYDPTRGIPFEAWAWLRIVGEMMHYIRDHESIVRVPRQLRAQGLKRVPQSDLQEAETLGAPDVRLTRLVNAVAVDHLLATLRPRERDILIALFFDEKTPVEIATDHGISQRQVSRLATRALKRLRPIA